MLYFLLTFFVDTHSRCDNGWFRINSTCFLINTLLNTTTRGASDICKKTHNADLAILGLSKKYIGQQLDLFLPGGDIKLHIGMLFVPVKKWNNGKSINSTFWTSYPTYDKYIYNSECLMQTDLHKGWALDIVPALRVESKGICQIDESK